MSLRFINTPDENAQFYSTFPSYGKNISFQWDELRKDLSLTNPIVRGTVYENQSSAPLHDSAMSGTEWGEYQFHNKYRIFWHKEASRLLVQKNTGTEATPVWLTALSFDTAADGSLRLGSFQGAISEVLEVGNTANAAFYNTSRLLFNTDSGFYLTSTRSGSQPIVNLTNFFGRAGTFIQETPAAEWEINHSFNTRRLQTTVYDTKYEEIQPTVERSARFPVAVAAAEWTITHNFGTRDVFCEAFDTDGGVRLTDQPMLKRLIVQNENVVNFYFDQARSGFALIEGIRDGLDKVDVSNVDTAYFYFSSARSGSVIISSGASGAKELLSAIEVKDGTSAYNTTELNFSGDDFYLSSDGGPSGNPVVNLGSPSGILVELDDNSYSKQDTTLVFESDDFSIATVGGNPKVSVSAAAGNAITFAESDANSGSFTDNSFKVDSTYFYMQGGESNPIISSKTPVNMLDLGFIADGGTVDTAVPSVASDGATITLTLDNTNEPGSSILFHLDGLRCSISDASTVALSAGDDDDPQINYVYVLRSGVSATIATNTSGWPTATHGRVATVFCQSASSLQTDGALKLHAWTDHFSSDTGLRGHINHLGAKFRSQHATWIDGVSLTPTVSGSSPELLDIATTSGTVFQLHPHIMPAISAGSEPVYIVNSSVADYTRSSDLGADILLDSDGDSTSNKHFSIVIWGVVNEAEADCKLMVNLPSGSYNTSSGATNDTSNFDNFTIPSDFVGTGFLIARLTLKHGSGGGGTWTVTQNEDLRGKAPGGTVAGSGTGGGAITIEESDANSGSFTDDTFKVDSTYFYMQGGASNPIISLHDSPGTGITSVTFAETESGGASIASDALNVDSSFFYLTSSGGSGNPILSLNPGFATGNYVATFPSPSTEWTVNHNFGTNDMFWAAYDDGDHALIPSKVDVSDPNTTYFYFAETIIGKAIVGGQSIAQLVPQEPVNVQFTLRAGTDDTFTVMEYSAGSWTIDSAYHRTDGGTISADVLLDGVSVTGLNALSLTTSQGSDTATGNNQVSVGSRIQLTTSANSAGDMVSISLVGRK